MKLARRGFLRVIGGGLAAPALSGAAWSQSSGSSQTADAVAAYEPNPDFTYVPGLTPLKAALRPYRKKTYRLEKQVLGGGKLVIHNYGHGGAGITMSWGCAQEVADILTAQYPNPAGKPVAVLGAGVMGLTAATWLTEKLRMQVTVYSKHLIPHTTSSIAGGQFAASKVAFQAGEKDKFVRILRRSHKEHGLRGSAYGVSPRDNYSLIELPSFADVPPDLVPRTQLYRLPFSPMNRPGWKYSTLLVEPPIFLTKLQQELQKNGVQFVYQEFFDEDQVRALAPDIIINCTGAGSDAIWPDPDLTPTKGQLVWLPAQPRLQYLFSGSGYVFPRADCVVIGGTEETSYTDDDPDPQRCAQLVQHLKDVFDGVATIAPTWMIQDE
ncbi:FAD-dependent oxidoreductase [Bradyrhizobium liaoningense]|uniref:FAD-dependent oxidoreductase n=1 Tax=Bradyrhizobium liaoningense TaxID=43992 RepID=UPI001BADAC54|nr:FAD-dependent oxidoreductase [Bradyrhizobium liaoningense]MBR0717006.1 FAD-binding oxidoreductase [Bradyrhizobium liaoningense]